MSVQKEAFASDVANHYNQVEQKSIRERNQSDIINLRKFNNAMKSIILHQGFKALQVTGIFAGEQYRVLDLGCGKGGDLPKYQRNERVALVVGFDIAEVSIEQCRERYKSFKQRRPFKGEFFVADLTTVDIDSTLHDSKYLDKFHVASCQFSLHYSFESYDKAVRYLSNAARNVILNGVFIGSYSDGPKIVKLARQAETPGLYEVGDMMSIKFSPEDLKNPQPFGTKYHFKLTESVDCPEFLVHPDVLERLLKRLGFYKIFDRSFEENLSELLDGPDRERVMGILRDHRALDFEDDNEGYLDEESWKTASVYRCFCYKKIVDI